MSVPQSAPSPGTGQQASTRGAAFFDLDKTLMQGSSAYQFARCVYSEGLMSRKQLLRDGIDNIRFRLGGASDDTSTALRERIAHQLKGVRERDLQRLGVPLLARILPRLYPQMLKIAYEHQDAGRPVYIVTAAAQDLADSLAHVMAFDGAIGSHLSDVKDGVYTGHTSGAFIYGEAKAVAIRELAQEHGYDLKDSYSYSDSASDLPMLRIVGHAVVVNPDQELAKLAGEQGWDVLKLDPIGARLQVGAGVLAAASIGGVAAAAFQYNRGARGEQARGSKAPIRARFTH